MVAVAHQLGCGQPGVGLPGAGERLAGGEGAGSGVVWPVKHGDEFVTKEMYFKEDFQLDHGGAVLPSFPRARYVVQRAELEFTRLLRDLPPPPPSAGTGRSCSGTWWGTARIRTP